MATQVVRRELGDKANGLDDEVLQYIASTIEEEEGEAGVDAASPLLEEFGAANSEQEAISLARQLAQKLRTADGEGRQEAPSEPKQLNEAKAIGGLTKEEQGEYRAPKGAIASIENHRESEGKHSKGRRRDERAAALVTERNLRAAKESEREAKPVVVRDVGSGGGSRDIKLERVTVTAAGRELIQDAQVVLSRGRRYGLVGRNGTGKTTLLRQIAHRQVEGLPPNAQVLHVEQEVVGDETTAMEAVLECDTERNELLEEERRLQDEGEGGENAQRLAQIYKRLDEIDAYSAEARASTILSGLSFSPDMQRSPTKVFSGGWRMRIALARALFVQPDILLLDEPTNHLDLHAVLWLEDCLQRWPTTLVIVSHAREFLNSVCTDIIHLHSRTLTAYRGNYDDFERTFSEMKRQREKQQEAQDRRRRQMQQFIDKFRCNAKRASLVQSRIKALEKMVEIKGIEEDPEYVFRFPDPGDKPGPPIISFNDVSFSYNPEQGPFIFRDLNFGIDLDTRVAIVGKNGVGKSTLLKLMDGQLQPTDGSIYRNPRVRVATFAQHHVDAIDLATTPMKHMEECFPGASQQRLRAHLGSFGLSGNLALQTVNTLSGGQKSRLALARVTWPQPHILFLDEVTNHMDIDAVDALVQGLATFEGGIVLISHDGHFITNTADELWAVTPSGRIERFDGTFDDYKRSLSLAAPSSGSV